MFKHVLVPIDLSDRNARIVRIGLMLAERSGARVTLLHVVQQVARIPPEELKAFYRRLVRAGQHQLTREAKRFATRGVPVETQILIGEPAREIVRMAHRRKVDLIVMGSHTVDPAVAGRGFGTTSYKVGIACRCPVLLVK